MAANIGIKLDFELKSFRDNVKRLRRENSIEIRKTLISGASAYATSAAKHTPPNPGAQNIDPVFYADGVLYDRSSSSKARGRRRVYDLLQLARNPDTGHYRKLYGKLLRQCYYYVVAIHREGRPVQFVPCRTEAEAVAKAHETYRGLSRAAWGLSFATLAGKMPPAFKKYLDRRPQLAARADLNTVTLDAARGEVTIVNRAIRTGENYLAALNNNASFVAVRTMNDRMRKYFAHKTEL